MHWGLTPRTCRRGSTMRVVPITEAYADLTAVLDSAAEDLEEVVITRTGHEPAVVIALREYESLKETLYLLGNPANVQHLARSIASLETEHNPR
ncbi:type II toxin-antitoxin system prevent-host-death family antitoxin [Nocardia sp. NPDC046473]|uniref:type II toxin-antitoxin system Phd/YefM family antitoxin n=1 Tax=Nocardia sp. NPDC046473 TaxID=3155733 RepID=UPI0033E330A5